MSDINSYNLVRWSQVASYAATKTGTFTKTCTYPLHGASYEFTKTYYSTVSQADAELIADASFNTDGQAFAEEIGYCLGPYDQLQAYFFHGVDSNNYPNGWIPISPTTSNASEIVNDQVRLIPRYYLGSGFNQNLSWWQKSSFSNTLAHDYKIKVIAKIGAYNLSGDGHKLICQAGTISVHASIDTSAGSQIIESDYSATIAQGTNVNYLILAAQNDNFVTDAGSVYVEWIQVLYKYQGVDITNINKYTNNFTLPDQMYSIYQQKVIDTDGNLKLYAGQDALHVGYGSYLLDNAVIAAYPMFKLELTIDSFAAIGWSDGNSLSLTLSDSNSPSDSTNLNIFTKFDFSQGAGTYTFYFTASQRYRYLMFKTYFNNVSTGYVKFSQVKISTYNG